MKYLLFNPLFFLILIIGALMISCSPLDKEANDENWTKAKSSLQSDKQLHQQKSSFIIDKIEAFLQQNKTEATHGKVSFKELKIIYEKKYDSLNSAFQEIRKINAVLDAIVEVRKAESVSLDSDRGFIIFTLEFRRVFEDTVDYMILTYQYIDDYDELYFSENSKLSHQAAEHFEGEMQVIMTDIFNGENEFIYLNTDLSATEVLQKNYGITDAESSKEKEYLKNGLKVMVSAVKLKAGGALKRRNGKWKYFYSENEA